MATRYTVATVSCDFQRQCPHCGKTYLVLHRPSGSAGGWGGKAFSEAISDAEEHGDMFRGAELGVGYCPQRCHHCGKYTEKDHKLAKQKTRSLALNLMLQAAFVFGILGTIARLADGDFVLGSFFMLILAGGITGLILYVRSEKRRDLNSNAHVAAWKEWWEKQGKSRFESYLTHDCRTVQYIPERY